MPCDFERLIQINCCYSRRNYEKIIRKKTPKSFYKRENHRSNNSQGFKPVCFLNAVEKCEIEE